jgi:DNA-binding NarL/FixJ family response regulator
MLHCAVALSFDVYHHSCEVTRTMPSRSRILIADDHNLVAELFQQLLADFFDVVGIVGDGHSLVRAAAELKPDLILIDVGMPLLNGLDAGRQVMKLLPRVKLVYMTLTSDADVAAEAFELGASGYLLKTCAAAEVVLAVHEVLRGKTYLSKAMSRHTINAIRWEQKKLVDVNVRLTHRQREVLQLVAEGKVMKEVGFILNMSPRTATYHKYQIMKKLGATSTAELVRYAIRNHIVAA